MVCFDICMTGWTSKNMRALKWNNKKFLTHDCRAPLMFVHVLPWRLRDDVTGDKGQGSSDTFNFCSSNCEG